MHYFSSTLITSLFIHSPYSGQKYETKIIILPLYNSNQTLSSSKLGSFCNTASMKTNSL